MSKTLCLFKITYTSLKKDDDTFGETKLKDNETYIAFLCETDQDNIYRSFAEHSYFKVENEKLMSLVKDIEFSKYDTIDQKVLIKDIRKSKYYRK